MAEFVDGSKPESTQGTSTITADPSSAKSLQASFEIDRAVKLASFSFAVYGTPHCLRWYFSNEHGVKIGFQSSYLIHQNFKALLMVSVLRAKDLPSENSFLEKVISGNAPDAYVTINLKGQHGYDQGITNVVKDTIQPVFQNQFFALLIEDPAHTILEVMVKDKNKPIGSSDTLIGTYLVQLSDIIKGMDDGKWRGWVEITNEAAVGRGDADTTAGQVDWSTFAKSVSNAALDLDRHSMALFFTNEETDTQGAFWWNKESKELQIVFRGTEISSIRDVLIDMNIIQKPLEGDDDKRLVHQGFREAFLSVIQTVYYCIDLVTQGDVAAWTIDVTGHSLGGALASLMAHNFARKYPNMAEEGRLHLYTHGAPRVGNKQFCEDINAVLHHSAFRIVNNSDVVPRMPGRKNHGLINYEHFGWTVLLTNEAIKQMSVYLEGEEDAVAAAIGTETTTAAEEGNAAAGTVGSKREEELEQMVKQHVPISLATVAAGGVDGEPASVEEVLHVAKNPGHLADMIATPSDGNGPLVDENQNGVNGNEDGGAGGASSMFRRRASSSRLIVSNDEVVEVRMNESILKGNPSDHFEMGYYEAMRKAFALMTMQAAAEKADAAGDGDDSQTEG